MEKLRDVATGRPVATLPPAVTRLPAAVVGDLDFAPTRHPLLDGMVQTARPRHWVKNLLVFAAPGAAGLLTHGDVLIRSLAAFAVFCVAASGAYFLNDAMDRDQDRLHSTKRLRPVAAGVVPVRLAVAVGLAAFTLAVAAGTTLGWRFALAVAAYAAVNLAYNLRLRYEPILDLAAVASGFVVRAVAGGLATGVPLSEWFLVVISGASLFVVAGKRTPDAVGAAAAAAVRRPRVAYPVPFLRYVRLLASGVALTAYCLWAFDRVAAPGQSLWFELTIVPFALAILRYALLVEQGGGGSPEELLLTDRTILAMVVIWAALFGFGVYGA